MNVTTDEIKAIKPGATEAFHCDKDKMRSLATVLSSLNRTGRPEGIVFYEHKKMWDKDIVIIRAMKEGDVPMLNR